ncbi:acyl-CoA thioester hydrolase/BAAT C-terminal domain-containing protein [Haladaptatus sp. NG-SE-30]
MYDEFVSGRPIRTDDLTGRLYPGLGSGPHPGVLVLHGGGGAGGYERAYAARLAEHGYTALCVEYFAAPGVSDVLHEIPLSYFGDAAEWLLDQPEVAGDRVGALGFSRGGEASLLVGTHFDSIGVVISYVPSCYAFPAPSWMDGVDEGCASWTLNGEPVAFLPVDKYVYEEDGIEESLGEKPPNPSTLALERSTAEEKERATIEVENIDGPVLLVPGGRDTVWPSTELSNRVIDRLERHDHPWSFEHREYPDAGHTVRVPYRFGEDDSSDGEHRFGGTNEANAHASADAWHHALRYLQKGIGE